MSDIRCSKVTFFKFQYFICAYIMMYILSVHTVSAVIACDSNQECAPDLFCVSNGCRRCFDGFYYNYSSSSCSWEKGLGKTCSSREECTSDLYCTSGICGCVTTDYYYDNPIGPCLLKKGYGETCSSSQECTSDLYCMSGTCNSCDGLFYYNSSLRSCFLKKTFQESCGSNQECISNLYCISGTCECVDDFYYDSLSRSCFLNIPFGQNCSPGIEQCVSNLICNATLTCGCHSGYYYNNSTSTCIQNIPFGQNCSPGIDQCVSNLICNATLTCGCLSGYYYNNSTSTCIQNIPFGQNCSPGIEQCVSNLICNATLTCGCHSGYYYNNSTSTCIQNIPFGQNCSPGIEQCVSNLICNATLTCGCHSGYYYNNSTSTCIQNIPFGQNCSPGIEQCVSNLICNATLTCGCHSGYYYNNSTSTCIQKLDHGAVCQNPQTTMECKASNTVCTYNSTSRTSKCLCTGDFYWGDSGSCIPRSNLQITARATKIETRSVIFGWSDMSQRSDVHYSIKWNVSNNMNANRTGVTVTNLKPGTLYNFSVVTSLPGDGNYPPITAEQPQAALWTRPDRPGPVSEVQHVTNSTYAITFGQSNGSVSHYTMNLSTVGSPIETESSTSTSTVIYFTKLKTATTYSYILESYNGHLDKSDPTTGQFTTEPEGSGPVGGFSYAEVQSHTANVTWQPPSQPNGAITGYMVEVALQNSAGCLYYIKIPCHGCDQAAPHINDTSLPSCTLMDANVTGSGNDYNLQLPNLGPYRNYTVKVRAVNVRGLGEPTTLTFQTSTSAPHDILGLTVYSVRDDNTLKINLNISWTSGIQTGPTDYYILVQEATGLDATDHNQSISPLTVTGYSSTTYVKYDVLAYWNYTVTVWAQTDKGNSSQKSAQHRTVENYPGAVQNLNVSQDATVANIVTLTFECPEIRSRNGSIEQFVITQTLLDPQDNDGKIPDIVYNQSASDGQSEPCSSGYKVLAKNIMVERNYSFTVMTVNNKYEGGVNNVSRFYVQPKVPYVVNPQEMFQVDSLVKQQDGSATEYTKIHADICSTCLTDVRWGTVNDVGILVCVKGANCTVPGTTRRFTYIPSWGSAKLRDFKTEYRTTPNKWIPPTDGNNKYHPFVVGDNTSCNHANAANYCNGPLPTEQEFYISVIMCTTAGCSVYTEPHVFSTYVREDGESPVGVIVGGVLGGLALIVVIGVILFLIRMATSRRENRESVRKNADTQVTSSNRHTPSSDKHTPKQTLSGHIELPQLRVNPHIYDEIIDYDYITEETVHHVRHSKPPRSRVNNVGHSHPPRSLVNNVGHSHPPRSLVNNVRSHRDVHQGIRDSQFPYENVVSVNRGRDYITYDNYF